MYDVVPFEDLQDCASKTVHRITTGRIGLSGGSTYAQLFPLWASLKPDCRNASFFPVDERKVPFDDPASNWGQANRLLLKSIDKEEDAGHFASSAQSYLRLLLAEFADTVPIFDTIFLGVGSDGHTASLFPGNAYLDDQSAIVLETVSPLPPAGRISLAPRVLASSRNLIVIINGMQKQAIVDAIIRNREDLPIVKILSRRTQSTVYVERGLIA